MALSKYMKALIAAVAAGAAALSVAAQDGTVSTSDLVTAGLAMVGALGTTYAVPNKPNKE